MRKFLLHMVVLALAICGSLPVSAQTFSNGGSITINDNVPASPYPSTISVSGITGTVTKVTITVVNWSHTFDADVGIKVSNPLGTPVVLDGRVGDGSAISGATVTFDMSASSSLASPITTGTFLPTASSFPTFSAPAPAGGGIDLNVYNGVNPNGTWSIWVQDFATFDVGSIQGGWSITFTTAVPEPTSIALVGLTCVATGGGWYWRKKKQNRLNAQKVKFKTL